MTRVIEMDAVSKAIAVSELFSVVLLDRLGQEALYGSKECSSNIFLVDNVGNVVWQVSSDFDSDGGHSPIFLWRGDSLKLTGGMVVVITSTFKQAERFRASY